MNADRQKYGQYSFSYIYYSLWFVKLQRRACHRSTFILAMSFKNEFGLVRKLSKKSSQNGADHDDSYLRDKV